MRADIIPLVPDVILGAKDRVQQMQVELETLRATGRESDCRALESAIAELEQMIRRNLQ